MISPLSPTLSPGEVHSLSHRINASTRSLHTQLNKLILVRLPLALPPHSANSSKYVSGLLHIAPIYITFESLWQSILDTPCLPATPDQASPFDGHNSETPLSERASLSDSSSVDCPRQSSISKACPRTQSLLSRLRLPGLIRADRLRADIRILTGKSDQQVEAELKAISKTGKLAEFIAHIKQSVEDNPHVLVAYTWVLYMALFAGGRYLRASLKAAGGQGKDFWDREPSPVRPHIVTRDIRNQRDSEVEFVEPSGEWSARMGGRGRAKSKSDSDVPKITPGLLFFEFIGDEDGEDIKREFKKRIADAEIHLTESEKEDIVEEAQDIFSFMLEMVAELDSVMGTNDEDVEISELFMKSPNLMTSRDSVFVAQERHSKKTSSTDEGKFATRKQSLLDVMFLRPVAKVVKFTGSSPRVSFQHDAKFCKGGLNKSWIERNAIVLPIAATGILFLAWYLGAWTLETE